MRTFTNGEIITAPILNETMWSFATYRVKAENVTLGTGGTLTAKYCRLGRGHLTFFTGYITFGTSPAITASATITVPTNINTDDENLASQYQWAHGTWIFRDASATAHYSGTLGTWNTSGTEVSFGGAWDGTAPRERINTNIPATVASNDRLSWSGWYIAQR